MHYIDHFITSRGFLSCEFSCGLDATIPYRGVEGTVTPSDITCPACLDVLAKKAQQSGQKS